MQLALNKPRIALAATVLVVAIPLTGCSPSADQVIRIRESTGGVQVALCKDYGAATASLYLYTDVDEAALTFWRAIGNVDISRGDVFGQSVYTPGWRIDSDKAVTPRKGDRIQVGLLPSDDASSDSLNATFDLVDSLPSTGWLSTDGQVHQSQCD